MTPLRIVAVVALGLLAAACDQHQAAGLPPPHEPGPDAIGTICRMALSEHRGPKGQVLLSRQDRPLWFSSVRDTFTWLLVEDGSAAGYAAIWVNDMGKSAAWDKPDAGAWVEARQAVFVVGSDMGSGMGETELVPFAVPAQARAFAARHGGDVLTFAQITRDVLANDTPKENHHGGTHHDHH